MIGQEKNWPTHYRCWSDLSQVGPSTDFILSLLFQTWYEPAHSQQTLEPRLENHRIFPGKVNFS